MALPPIAMLILAPCSLFRWQFQQFGRLDLKHGRELADDLQAGIAGAFFKLAHVAAVYVCLKGQFLLGQPFGVAEAAQIGGKDLAQIHAPANPDVAY